jgi:hypothetical protein
LPLYLGNGCHEKLIYIYRYERSFKLNLVNHISLMFGWKDQIFYATVSEILPFWWKLLNSITNLPYCLPLGGRNIVENYYFRIEQKTHTSEQKTYSELSTQTKMGELSMWKRVVSRSSYWSTHWCWLGMSRLIGQAD